jgi:hypothetical protein
LVLVLPSGPSAHLEAAWAAARGCPVFVLALKIDKPDLMVLLLGPPERICTSMSELFEKLGLDAMQ